MVLELKTDLTTSETCNSQRHVAPFLDPYYLFPSIHKQFTHYLQVESSKSITLF